MQLPCASTLIVVPDSERNFIVNYDGSKASEVVNLHELAEHILSFLDIKSIIKTTRVCRQLKDTLDSSEKLRTMTFLTLVPQKTTLKSMPSRIGECTIPEDFEEQNQQLFNNITNPLFFHGSRRFDSNLVHLRFDNNLLNGPIKLSYLFFESGLQIYIPKAKEYRKILRLKESSARNMVLAYQPKSIQLNLEVEHTLKGQREYLWVAARIAAHITAGGLVDVVNLIWKRLCDTAQEWRKDITRETIEKMAKRRGMSVVQWLETDVVVLGTG